MMPLRRVFLALVCTVLAVSLLFILSAIPLAFRYGLRRTLPGFEMFPVYLAFALPGWVLVLPFVLWFENAEGWHVWAILGIGTAIGPCFLVAWTLLASRGHFNAKGDGFGLVAALAIGFLTSVLYVIGLRYLQGRVEGESPAP